MPTFSNAKYFRILPDALGVGLAIPFSVFARYGKEKLIPWISHGEIFSLEKHAKIRSGSFNELFVPFAEKETYFLYLDIFFLTEDGARLVDQLKKTDPASLIGLPTPSDYSFKAWPERPEIQSDSNILSIEVEEPTAATPTASGAATAAESSSAKKAPVSPSEQIDWVKFLKQKDKVIESLRTELVSNDRDAQDQIRALTHRAENLERELVDKERLIEKLREQIYELKSKNRAS